MKSYHENSINVAENRKNNIYTLEGHDLDILILAIFCPFLELAFFAEIENIP